MSKDLRYLGIDLGASGMKIVELVNDAGRARLTTYGFTEYETGGVSYGETFANTEMKGKELRELCEKAGIKTNRAITGLPMSTVFTTLFSFLDSTDKELEAQVKSKLKNLAPIPEEDMVIDWKKVSAPGEDKLVRVSVTAASKKQITNYVEIFKTAGMQLASLETEAFALIRSLLGKDKALSVVVDVGAAKTNVLVVKEGVPVIHRTVKTGGENITKFIALKFGVDAKKAEEIKKNLLATKSDGIESMVREIAQPVINEIKYCQNLYAEQYNSGNIEKLVLSGGSALVAGLAEVLQKETGLRSFIGDPWARVIYPDELRPVLDKIGSRFSVAIGLAMRDML
jgi:type IV pilus assembly protein PilM